MNEKTNKHEQNSVGPMQMVLIALAGCTSSDVVSILKKQRQDLQKLDIRVTGQRGEEYPKVRKRNKRERKRKKEKERKRERERERK